jgi:hypothetical protein
MNMPDEFIQNEHNPAEFGADEVWSDFLNPGMILRYTRHWIHYGTITFVVVCSVVAAVRGLAGQ